MKPIVSYINVATARRCHSFFSVGAFNVRKQSGSVCVCEILLPLQMMVKMMEMESQCEYFMYFPAVPITDLSDPARYRTLPRRSHLYLGETVRFLLVLRCRDAAETGKRRRWRR